MFYSLQTELDSDMHRRIKIIQIYATPVFHEYPRRTCRSQSIFLILVVWKSINFRDRSIGFRAGPILLDLGKFQGINSNPDFESVFSRIIIFRKMIFRVIRFNWKTQKA